MGRRAAQRGFTLLEALVVVALIGILAAIAIPAFSETRRRAANRSEVEEFFAEIRIRQQQYYRENGTFLATGANESATFPSAPSAGGTNITTLPAAWKTLGIRPPDNTMRCAYVSLAGKASTGSAGAKAAQMGFSVPAKAWYYVLARCNADNNSASDAYFLVSSENGTIVAQNDDD